MDEYLRYLAPLLRFMYASQVLATNEWEWCYLAWLTTLRVVIHTQTSGHPTKATLANLLHTIRSLWERHPDKLYLPICIGLNGSWWHSAKIVSVWKAGVQKLRMMVNVHRGWTRMRAELEAGDFRMHALKGDLRFFRETPNLKSCYSTKTKPTSHTTRE